MGTSRFRGHAPAALMLVGATLALSGCGGGVSDLSRTFGFTRDAPDEFTVATQAPLSMPPDFSLRPPLPGARRPMQESQRVQAEEALAPQTALGGAPAASSPGQDALVQAAGPAVNGNIRRRVDEDARMQQADRGFVDKLLFWQSDQPHGIEVDPQKEAQRLRENAALGQSQQNGDTPIIQPRKKGWLEGLF